MKKQANETMMLKKCTNGDEVDSAENLCNKMHPLLPKANFPKVKKTGFCS